LEVNNVEILCSCVCSRYAFIPFYLVSSITKNSWEPSSVERLCHLQAAMVNFFQIHLARVTKLSVDDDLFLRSIGLMSTLYRCVL